MSEIPENEQEVLSFKQVVHMFLSYGEITNAELDDIERTWKSLGEDYVKYVPKIFEKLETLRECAMQNQAVLGEIVTSAGMMSESLGIGKIDMLVDQEEIGSPNHLFGHIKSSMKMLVRDWSTQGRREREDSYEPLIEEIARLLPISDKENPPKLLIPGSGLGRLCFEFAKAGYNSLGNEFSFFMLIISFYILNSCLKPGQCTIYPYINQHLNVLSLEAMTKGISFPDVEISGIPEVSNFSMCAGDFLEVFMEDYEVFDGIVTCFFIDTARNIIDYIKLIWNLLKPGGYWVNLGPLLYHYAEIEEKTIELNYTEVRHVISEIGFQFLKESFRTCHYSTDPDNMLQSYYNCAFFVCTKVQT